MMERSSPSNKKWPVLALFRQKNCIQDILTVSFSVCHNIITTITAHHFSQFWRIRGDYFPLYLALLDHSAVNLTVYYICKFVTGNPQELMIWFWKFLHWQIHSARVLYAVNYSYNGYFEKAIPILVKKINAKNWFWVHCAVVFKKKYYIF